MTTDPLSGFFPTPKPLIHKILSGIDFRRVDSVLEPSAGKGDLADEIRERLTSAHRRGYRSEYVADMADDEKAVIDSFEGRESYEQVLTSPQYFLGGVKT